MIPVQKSFPPERLRYMRKVMKDESKTLSAWRNKTQMFTWGIRGVPLGLWDLICLATYGVKRATICRVKFSAALTPFDRWKLSQRRQSWLYEVIGGAVLALIAFVVAGGCR